MMGLRLPAGDVGISKLFDFMKNIRFHTIQMGLPIVFLTGLLVFNGPDWDKS